jgi:hypothetical protein
MAVVLSVLARRETFVSINKDNLRQNSPKKFTCALSAVCDTLNYVGKCAFVP